MKAWFAGAALALFCLSGCATAPKEQAEAPVPPLEYVYRQLDNGLRVYAMPDANTSTVSVQVWYDVGSKDDPPGRSGFAHLFEHIMFKSTRNMPAEQMDRLTEDVGGFNNASTYDDFTNYYEVVPAHHLQRLLWAESERMGSLVVDEEVFQSEREVVKEEYRQRYLSSPYGMLFYYVTAAGFDVHPYGRPGIGNIEELDAATVEDVRAFHAQYYRPDNAVLVVAGNFDVDQLNAWVDEYFAPLQTPERTIPRVDAIEPTRTEARNFTVYEPNTPLPAVAVTYPSLAARDPDMAALMVMDGIASTGESSRLYQALVYEQQRALQAFTYFEPTEQPGQFIAAAILSDGQSAEDGLASLDAELARLRDEDVSEAELEEAKNEILASALDDRETAYGRAFALAESVTRYGEPDYADDLLAAVARVTAADVRRVAQRVLNDDARAVIHYLPEEMADGASGDTVAVSSTIEATPLSVPADEIPITVAASEAERVAPPAPGAPVEARMPAPSERTLANGLRVIVSTEQDLPLVSAQLRVRTGSAADPEGRAGATDMMAALLTKGAGDMSATDIARAIESLGADISAGAGADSATLALQSRTQTLDDAFKIFADVARAPTFADEEVERQRSQAIDDLSVSMRQPGALANMAMSRLLYADTPYGDVATPETLSAITREDIVNAHDASWRPDNAVLVIAGDITSANGFALAERYFGNWSTAEAATDTASAQEAVTPSRRTIVVDVPDMGQSAVAYGVVGPARGDEDYFPMLVANSVLGGGFSSRLSSEIRIKRGLSYGAYSSFPARLEGAPIVAFAQTRNEATAQVVALMNEILAGIGAETVPDAELAARKAALIGRFARDVETTSGLAGQLAQIAAFDLPLDALASYIDDVDAISAEDVEAAAAEYLDPARASVVVVGDAQQFFDAVKNERAAAERINVDDIDFNAADLN